MDSGTPKLGPGGTPPLARFEVRGLDADRDLIRSLARRLAGGGPEAARLRAAVAEPAEGKPDTSKVGGILAALRASPLVGSGIDLTRDRVDPRDLDL